MTDIKEMEARLSRALDRISTAAGKLAAPVAAAPLPPAEEADIARLRAELEGERAKDCATDRTGQCRAPAAGQFGGFDGAAVGPNDRAA